MLVALAACAPPAPRAELPPPTIPDDSPHAPTSSEELFPEHPSDFEPIREPSPDGPPWETGEAPEPSRDAPPGLDLRAILEGEQDTPPPPDQSENDWPPATAEPAPDEVLEEWALTPVTPERVWETWDDFEGRDDLFDDEGEELETLPPLGDLIGIVSTWRVGVLLPLSGPFSELGDKALRALELALSDSGAAIELEIADSLGTPDGAQAAVESLFHDREVVAAVGPVGYTESHYAAELAEKVGLPLLPLSARADLASGRDYVLRTFVSRGEEARAIARYAVVEAGLPAVAVIHPNNAYGRELAEAFVEEVLRLGGHVTAHHEYQSGDEPQEVVMGLLGRRRAPEKELELRELGFEALFIADTARNVRAIVPYLKYMRVPLRTHPARRGVQLLGAGGWTTPTIVDPAEGLTDNAVFVSAFVADAEDSITGGFLRSFHESLGGVPSPFQAECYDTMSLLLHALGSAGDRASLLEELHRVRNWMGVTGIWSIMADGRARRSVSLMTVDGGLLRARLGEDEERALRRAP